MFIYKKAINKHFAYANSNAKIKYMFMFTCNSNKLLNEQKGNFVIQILFTFHDNKMCHILFIMYLCKKQAASCTKSRIHLVCIQIKRQTQAVFF